MELFNCAAANHADDPELCRLCRRAVEKIDSALDEHPHKVTSEVDVAENAVAKLRDILIDRYRHASESTQAEASLHAAEIRKFLDSVNTAMSLIAGVVYPVAGIERSNIEEARKVLKGATGPCAEVRESR